MLFIITSVYYHGGYSDQNYMTRRHKRHKSIRKKIQLSLSVVDLTIYLENQHNQHKSIITKVGVSKIVIYNANLQILVYSYNTAAVKYKIKYERKYTTYSST